MIPLLDDRCRERRLRLFADRSSAGMEDKIVRNEFRSGLLRKAVELRGEGVNVCADPRFRFWAMEEDLDEGRLDYLIRQFNGHWHTLLTVNSPIAQGEQILMDYGDLYWEGHTLSPELLSP